MKFTWHGPLENEHLAVARGRRELDPARAQYQPAARHLALHEQDRAAGIGAQVAGSAKGSQHIRRQATKPLVFPQFAADAILNDFQTVGSIHRRYHLANLSSRSEE